MLGCFNNYNFYAPKNISFKASISDKEIDELKYTKQYFSDCYLMSTLEALSHTKNGRRILKDNFKYDDYKPNIINCYLYNKNGVRNIYSVPIDFVVDEYKKVYDNQPNKIIRTANIAVNEFEKEYKSKPTICQIGDNFKNYEFEYNLPSNFMKMLTGIEPRVIAETDLNVDLTKYKSKVLELFAQMDKEKDFSFVISTGMKALDCHRWHVYVIENVDLKNNTITVKEKRSNKPQTMTIDEALKTFKFIAGYFNSDLENIGKTI